MNRGSEKPPRAPSLRSRLREATADAILQAAEETIAAHGLSEARMASIAERAGVSVGTLYNHFEDKSSLLAALVDVRRRELRGRIDAALEAAHGEPFRAQLAAFTEALATHFDLHRRFIAVLWDEESARGAPMVRRAEPSIKDVYRRLEKLIDLGVREGALRREGSAVLAAAFMGMAKGVLVRRHAEGRGPRAQAATLMRLFLDGASVAREVAAPSRPR